jgi:hypothetical protein
MAKFMVKFGDGEIPAETCSHCNGIGYLTKPLTYKSRKPHEETAHIHRAGSADKCPMCLGQGWVGLAGKN